MSNDIAVAVADLLVAAEHEGPALPVWLVDERDGAAVAGLSAAQKAWVASLRFTGSARRLALLPGADGGLGGALLGLGLGRSGDPAGPACLLAGLLPAQLPPGLFALDGRVEQPELAAIAWGLGAYRFRRYKTANNGEPPAQLKLPAGVDRARVAAIVEAVWLARDLINTPASDLGPEELEAATRALACQHGAEVTSIVGDDLLARGFTMIHAVGRASPREPRLIDLRWSAKNGRADAPRVTLVGKGICFDTGGLDIKPSSGMLLM